MRARNRTYKDYGFQHGEEKYVKYLAREPNYEQRLLLYDAAYEADASIADDMVYSIVRGISYENLTEVHYIPINKGDFYSKCKITLALFRDRMKEYGAL